jgi:hypothetical protein
MSKDYFFYRVHLERDHAGSGEPGLLAATEVVQAVCDAGFQRDGFIMKDYDSSPRCFYKYAKTPKEGMYMMRAVKKTDQTTLNILIDTRMYPSLVMIEKHTDWQEETEEVIVTLEQIINNDTYKFNWRINLQKHTPQSTQNLKEFFSALSYMEDIEDTHEKHNSNVHIGQLILKVNGNNYYNDNESLTPGPSPKGEGDEESEEVIEQLKPLFYNNEDNVRRFLREIDGLNPNNITDLVNQWVKDKLISDYGNSRKGALWEILNDAGLYTKSRQNWCRRVY